MKSPQGGNHRSRLLCLLKASVGMAATRIATLTIARRIGLVFATVHFALVCYIAATIWIARHEDQEPLAWVGMYILDLPIAWLWPVVAFGLANLLPVPKSLEFFLHGVLINFIFFGLYGSLFYYLGGAGLCLVFQKLSRILLKRTDSSTES
jgi:hypothetical protein